MTCSIRYAPLLRKRGFRMTPQRLAILHTLHHAGRHLSPAEVYKLARKQTPGLTEPTVYRALEFFVQHGVARIFQNKNGHVSYEIAREEHHHLVCRACGKETEVRHALLKSLYKKLEAASGYQLSESHLTFFGLCSRCKDNLKNKKE